MAHLAVTRDRWAALLNRLAPYVLVVLIVLLCWRLASVVWLAAAPPRVPAVAVQSLPMQPPPQVPSVSNFTLFKVSQPTPQPINAPVTPPVSEPLVDFASIPLHLEGVIVDSPATRSRAIIRLQDKSLSYKLGQKLESTGLVLAAIHNNFIVVRHKDGSMGRLNFGDATATAIHRPHRKAVAPMPGSGMSSAPMSVGMPELGQLPTGASMSMPPSGSAAANAGVSAQLADAVQQLRTNSGTYLSKMGMRSTSGGYEVTAAAPDQLRSQLGLRPGDKIVSINGQALGNPQNDAAILQQIQQSRSAQIELQRGDQTLTLSQNF